MYWTPPNAALLDAACEPYRNAGRFAYYFARGKLRADPVYRAILELGLLLGRARVLDLGCGQGLLAAWLRAAERCYERGSWPRAWPPAPQAPAVSRMHRRHHLSPIPGFSALQHVPRVGVDV